MFGHTANMSQAGRPMVGDDAVTTILLLNYPRVVFEHKVYSYHPPSRTSNRECFYESMHHNRSTLSRRRLLCVLALFLKCREWRSRVLIFYCCIVLQSPSESKAATSVQQSTSSQAKSVVCIAIKLQPLTRNSACLWLFTSGTTFTLLPKRVKQD
jgi:hypothetical protein